MSAHATIRSGYRGRLAVVCVAFIILGLWFLYDAAIGWPRQQQMQQVYAQLRAEHKHTWRNEWRDIAWDKGWPSDPPEEAEKQTVSDIDIALQWVVAALILPVGIAAGVIVLRLGDRWISTDTQGVHTNSGQHVKWEDILWLDKSRWQKKGIAVVRYKDENGRTRRITLDDWKYYREPTAQMLNEIEMHLADHQKADDLEGEANPDSKDQVVKQREAQKTGSGQ